MTTATLRRFGKSNLGVAPVGFGTWPIGGARYGGSDDAAATRAIHAALDAGVTCFDTAPSYGAGHAEELLGRALAGRRDQVTVITKGGLIWNDQSHILGQNSQRQHLMSGLDDSLRRLGMEDVDLFVIHWPDLDTPFAETMATLEEIVATGKARHIGVCNFTGEQLREASAHLSAARLVCNQVSYHLFDQRWAGSSFDVCDELGMGAMAYGPLAHGLLSGAFTRGMTFDPTDWRSSGMIFGQALLTPENLDRNLDVVDRLVDIAADLGTTLPRLAIAWVLSHPIVAVALVGARNEVEIADSAAAAELVLDAATLDAITNAMRGAAGLSEVLMD